MLVLSRKVGESVIIGGNIEMVVYSLSKDGVGVEVIDDSYRIKGEDTIGMSFQVDTGDSITFTDGVTVKMLGLTNGQARLGFEAPRSVSINREEIQRRIDNGV